LRGADVVYLEKMLPRASRFAMPSVIGDRMPATCTGVGKALLAFASDDLVASAFCGPMRRRTARSLGSPQQARRELDAIRDRGYAIDREEAADGLACVAVPVLAATAAVAAISVSFPATAGSGQALVAPLRATAAAISRSPAMRFASAA
jgi:DNA-binding IclR family transcriptional regulator